MAFAKKGSYDKTEHRAMVLISGGIDSPVASYVLRDYGQLPVYFDNFPFSGEDTRERALETMRLLGFDRALVVPHGPALAELSRKCDRKYQCVLCRRMMFRVSSLLAEKHGCSFLITGENIAQVASQTLHNIHAEVSASSVPIVRPLICFDKEDIIRVAKEAGTFTASTRPASCCMIVPKKPSTMAYQARIESEEAKADVNGIAEKSVRNVEIVQL